MRFALRFRPRFWASLAAGALVVMLARVSPAGAQTPTPTPGGDCCTSHGGPSCDTPACQACVCDPGLDPECCTGIWDATCAEEAANECSASCPACPTPTPTTVPTPGGDCCSAHDPGYQCDDSTCNTCMCALDSSCCDPAEGWDDICAAEAAEPDPNGCRDECPCKGNCCVSQGGDNDGCEDSDCESCVCGQIDPSCCTNGWDETCVQHANEDLCGPTCACGGLPGDCCLANDTAGCQDQDCQDCVCQGDGDQYCCQDVWDDECAGRANDPNDCGPVCACTGEPQHCCFPHTSGGCEDDDCENCVFDVEPACRDQWDVVCVDRALTDCQDVCACGPTPAEDCCVESLAGGCDEDSCEQCVCNLDDSCCSGSWDLTCVNEAANSTACTGQCLCQPRAVDDCCIAQTGTGCSDATCQQCVCDLDPDCCNSLWDRTCASEAANECADSCGVCQRPCVGDCLGQGSVNVTDLLTGVNILLGNLPIDACPAYDFNGAVDNDGNPLITIDELVAAVDASLNGCR